MAQQKKKRRETTDEFCTRLGIKQHKGEKGGVDFLVQRSESPSQRKQSKSFKVIKRDKIDRKWSDLFSRLADAEDGAPRFSVKGGPKYLFHDYSAYTGGHKTLDEIIAILESNGIDDHTTGSDSPLNVSSYETRYDFEDGGLRIYSGNAFFDSPKHGPYIFGFRALRWIIDKLGIPQPRRFKAENKQTKYTFQEGQGNAEREHEESIEREGDILVASGEIGDRIDWEPGFEALGEVQWILSHFEDLGAEESIDWNTIVGGHHYFEGIQSTSFPPLYNERDFEQVFSEFLAIIEEPLNERPGMSFNQLYLYVETDKREMVVQEFSRFLEHLKGLKILQDAEIV